MAANLVPKAALLPILALLSSSLQPSKAAISTFLPNDPFQPPNGTYSKPPTRASLAREKTTMRAWTCHGRTQREMVEKLASASIVQSPTIRDAMFKVDRANYAVSRSGAYNDNPQPIGYGQTISAPHMHAHALEVLLPALVKRAQDNPEDDLKILDVGCGSGYLTACFGRMVDRGEEGPIPPLVKGKVYGIDVFPELVSFTTSNINKEDGDLFDSGTVQLQVGDGWVGLPEASPFHAIHVGAAAATFPENLMMQLAVGGVMVCPVGPDGGFQNLYRIERMAESQAYHRDDFAIKSLLGVRYVPLFHP